MRPARIFGVYALLALACATLADVIEERGRFVCSHYATANHFLSEISIITLAFTPTRVSLRQIVCLPGFVCIQRAIGINESRRIST